MAFYVLMCRKETAHSLTLWHVYHPTVHHHYNNLADVCVTCLLDVRLVACVLLWHVYLPTVHYNNLADVWMTGTDTETHMHWDISGWR